MLCRSAKTPVMCNSLFVDNDSIAFKRPENNTERASCGGYLPLDKANIQFHLKESVFKVDGKGLILYFEHCT